MSDEKDEWAIQMRVLAIHMLTCIKHMESCTYETHGCLCCKYDAIKNCNFEERMKALGIEVEE